MLSMQRGYEWISILQHYVDVSFDVGYSLHLSMTMDIL